jgi:hypothetical protein
MVLDLWGPGTTYWAKIATVTLNLTLFPRGVLQHGLRLGPIRPTPHNEGLTDHEGRRPLGD